ncbi:hypothetical protein PCANC_04502 [Puccinia coronata f. sp. avenae]|uniref:SigF-like NTF2-like domain-containing protein n=1 Tax=Puccinia coronata f. sp. avenae TaxID=200324 RepID=A0A2N5UXD7_9BASI|nr:hypothetical protein PCASD_14018 [Puccinia coronata f. sp. avenae]PLW41717.1 hypothetical protein PCASD_05684 [Puccinia coronata f. sp. avenae]PLW42430.1 hypothetical protein PCANC_09889 [Puccinia coronata f. sp. avenae]PLW54239.1 hypothetical protein PCANC_04502 [Puccinia coronata f. sp. avenae]
MDDPVKELPEVVRKITEPYAATEIVRNVNKYFTDDAYLLYPMINQPHTKNGKTSLMGIYKLFRVLTINNQIEFHAVMFSEDRLHATIELTETLQGRFIPIWVKLRFISRVDLRKESDGKYRICKQEDNYPNDLKRAGLDFIPGLAQLLAIWKLILGLTSATVGNFYLKNAMFGP